MTAGHRWYFTTIFFFQKQKIRCYCSDPFPLFIRSINLLFDFHCHCSNLAKVCSLYRSIHIDLGLFTTTVHDQD